MKRAPKAKEILAPPEAEGKAKALKAKEAVPKGIHSHKKEDPHTHLLTLKDTVAPNAAYIFSRQRPHEQHT